MKLEVSRLSARGKNAKARYQAIGNHIGINGEWIRKENLEQLIEEREIQNKIYLEERAKMKESM